MTAHWQKHIDRLDGAFSDHTLRSDRSDFGLFAAWCRKRRVTFLPSSSETVAAYRSRATAPQARDAQAAPRGNPQAASSGRGGRPAGLHWSLCVSKFAVLLPHRASLAGQGRSGTRFWGGLLSVFPLRSRAEIENGASGRRMRQLMSHDRAGNGVTTIKNAADNTYLESGGAFLDPCGE